MAGWSAWSTATSSGPEPGTIDALTAFHRDPCLPSGGQGSRLSFGTRSPLASSAADFEQLVRQPGDLPPEARRDVAGMMPGDALEALLERFVVDQGEARRDDRRR